jgi:hypothetical protein
MGHMKRTVAREEAERRKGRVYMSFFLRHAWHVTFLESDLKTPIGKGLNFTDHGTITEMWRRCGESRMSEDRNARENAIEKGRGGCFLRLTPEQYAKLR